MLLPTEHFTVRYIDTYMHNYTMLVRAGTGCSTTWYVFIFVFLFIHSTAIFMDEQNLTTSWSFAVYIELSIASRDIV